MAGKKYQWASLAGKKNGVAPEPEAPPTRRIGICAKCGQGSFTLAYKGRKMMRTCSGCGDTLDIDALTASGEVKQ